MNNKENNSENKLRVCSSKENIRWRKEHSQSSFYEWMLLKVKSVHFARLEKMDEANQKTLVNV